jgi:type II secretory ATPase GspE/PulE/Tfp pilus assembly ATPase PilB-like protein
VWPSDLKRHLKSKHGQQKPTLKKQQQPYTPTPEQQQQPYRLITEQQQPYRLIPEQQQQQPYTFTPEQQQQQQQQQQPYTFTPEQQQQQPQQPYSQSNEEEPYYILKTNNPYTFYVPDKYDPDHFMTWVHPFTSVISGPTGSGKSVFVMRFVHNIKHMMTPIPHRIL